MNIKTRMYKIAINNIYYDFLIPDLCPNCGVSNNPSSSVEASVVTSKSERIGFLTHKCLSCNKIHYSIQSMVVEQNTQIAPKLLCLYPNKEEKRQFHKLIEELSPRFVNVYHQAQMAEQNEAYTIAGMGYRAALEILIKDYALNSLQDDKNKISKMKLADCIAHYFKGDTENNVALFNSADVFRIFGNDFAHWDHPEDFSEQESINYIKSYLDIFVSIIKTKLMCLNPPVKRPQNNQKN